MNATTHAEQPLPKRLDIKFTEKPEKLEELKKPDVPAQKPPQKKKKRKEKKKKKKPIVVEDKSKGYLGFESKPRRYPVTKPKKKQTNPPSIPVQKQFPDGNYPTGEFMDHPGDL